MGVQEAHAGTLAGVLSNFPGPSEGSANPADVAATAHFYPSDPAIRLGPTVDLRSAGGQALSGAHVRIDAVRDGEAELLLYDLGGSRILPSIDYLPTHGVLDVHFVGMAPADAYARLLSSLRYINRAAQPTPGDRSIDISVLDANGVETPVGHLDLTVQSARAALTVDSLEKKETVVPVDDEGPNPFALVVWDKADGTLDGDGILGWHRAGDDLSRPFSDPLSAGVAGENDEPAADDPALWENAGETPMFDGDALHLYGAADVPSDWSTPRGTVLSPVEPSNAGVDADYGNDEPQIGGEEYRIFMAAAWNDSRIGAIELPTNDPADIGSGAHSETVVLSPVVAAGATTAGDESLQPAELFTVDSAPEPSGRPAVEPTSTGQSSAPRLDAFLVGLPPSGDPLTAPDPLAKPAGDDPA